MRSLRTVLFLLTLILIPLGLLAADNPPAQAPPASASPEIAAPAPDTAPAGLASIFGSCVLKSPTSQSVKASSKWTYPSRKVGQEAESCSCTGHCDKDFGCLCDSCNCPGFLCYTCCGNGCAANCPH